MKRRTSTRTVLLTSFAVQLGMAAASIGVSGGNWASTAHYHQQYRRRLVPWTVLMTRGGDQEEMTLDQKVRAAMQKLGISPPPPPPPPGTEETISATTTDSDPDDGCVDGVCPMPPTAEQDTSTAQMLQDEEPQPEESTSDSTNVPTVTTTEPPQDAGDIAKRISQDLDVDASLAWAALGATSSTDDRNQRIYNESAARGMIQQELDMIAQIPADSDQVKQLVSEGFDPFLSRRALAFAERNMEDARAILLADKMDAEEEELERQMQEEQEQRAAEESSGTSLPAPHETFKAVAVDADFDPTRLGTTAPAASMAASVSQSAQPPPANKADVVFDATADQIHELVLESPVPVLVDVYADWCGPCKALTPILEEMAIKGGGVFRLVKVNSDNERAISSALGVQALPTVFGVRDGKIRHMFQGMPKSQEAMRSFMMGLLMGNGFDPPVTPHDQEKYNDLSMKLLKTAAAASFSFSARERLSDRVAARLEALEEEAGVLQAEAAGSTIRSLLNNIVQNPFDPKFRKVNIANPVIANKIAKYPAAVGILKNAGFALDSSTQVMTIGKGKKLVNVSPLTVVRDSIDKWIDLRRYEVAKAARKEKDEVARLKLLAEAEAAGDMADEDDDEEEEEEVDPDACTLQLRMHGKKKIHTIELRADDPLEAVLKKIPVSLEDGQEAQITCVAKRLVVKSSDKSTMRKSLRDLKLSPSAAIVVTVGDKTTASVESSASKKLSERAAAQKKKKTGSHTMQSIGIYAKDDNNKAELIDGGGGVWYEHDVSDDEKEEENAKDKESEEKEGNDKTSTKKDSISEEGDEDEELERT